MSCAIGSWAWNCCFVCVYVVFFCCEIVKRRLWRERERRNATRQRARSLLSVDQTFQSVNVVCRLELLLNVDDRRSTITSFASRRLCISSRSVVVVTTPPARIVHEASRFFFLYFVERAWWRDVALSTAAEPSSFYARACLFAERNAVDLLRVFCFCYRSLFHSALSCLYANADNSHFSLTARARVSSSFMKCLLLSSRSSRCTFSSSTAGHNESSQAFDQSFIYTNAVSYKTRSYLLLLSLS